LCPIETGWWNRSRAHTTTEAARYCPCCDAARHSCIQRGLELSGSSSRLAVQLLQSISNPNPTSGIEPLVLSISLKAKEELGIGLKEHGPSQKLSPSNCHLEDEEIATMMEHLNNHPSLYKLDLGVNFCKEQGTKGLAQLLMSSCPLISLNLSIQYVWDN
jgi:hypothetical protein